MMGWMAGVALVVCSWVCISRGQLDERLEDGNVIFINEVQVPVVWQIFNSTTQTVDAGVPLNLKCGIHGDYDGCEWQGPSGVIYDVYEQVYKGLVAGVSKPTQTHGNECGIEIAVAGKEHSGKWTCTVSGLRALLSRSKDVKVVAKTLPPPGSEMCSSVAVPSGYCVPFTSCPDKLDEPLKFLTLRQFVEAYGCGTSSAGVARVCCPE